jgi:hypothetical protein
MCKEGVMKSPDVKIISYYAKKISYSIFTLRVLPIIPACLRNSYYFSIMLLK